MYMADRFQVFQEDTRDVKTNTRKKKVCEIDSVINISTNKWLSNKQETLKVNDGEISQ